MNEGLVPSDVQTLERLMNTYGDSLLRMCCLLLHDKDQARDAVQDTFIKAYRALASFHEGASEKAWLTRIAVNICHDVQRKTWWRLMDRRVTPDDLPDFGKSDEYNDKEVITAVMNLPEKPRRAIVLHYYEGLSAEEIAKVLDVSASTVRSQLSRGREKLYAALKGWYFDEE